jgi:hypothetical protein
MTCRIAREQEQLRQRFDTEKGGNMRRPVVEAGPQPEGLEQPIRVRVMRGHSSRFFYQFLNGSFPTGALGELQP